MLKCSQQKHVFFLRRIFDLFGWTPFRAGLVTSPASEARIIAVQISFAPVICCRNRRTERRTASCGPGQAPLNIEWLVAGMAPNYIYSLGFTIIVNFKWVPSLSPATIGFS